MLKIQLGNRPLFNLICVGHHFLSWFKYSEQGRHGERREMGEVTGTLSCLFYPDMPSDQGLSFVTPSGLQGSIDEFREMQILTP